MSLNKTTIELTEEICATLEIALNELANTSDWQNYVSPSEMDMVDTATPILWNKIREYHSKKQ